MKVELTKKVTFGLVGYAESLFLHAVSPLKYIVSLLVVLHAVAGLGLLITKKVKRGLFAVILELINITIAGIVFTAQLTILEFL